MNKYFLFFILFTLQAFDQSREPGSFTQELDEQSSLQCAICTENTPGLWYCLNPCKHVFHHNCIDEWMRLYSSCPSCRAQVVDYEKLPFTVARLLQQEPNLGIPVRVISLFPSTRLWNLDLTSKGLESLEGLETIQEHDQVRMLFLSLNNIKEIPNNVFENFNNLHVLILNNNKIERVQQGAFAGLSNLKEVFFDNNNLSDEQQASIKQEIAQVTNNQAKVSF